MATYFLVALGGSITMGIYGYVSDQSKPRNRRFRISAVEMVMFGGGIFGPIGYGYWIKESGYFYPGLITVGGVVTAGRAIGRGRGRTTVCGIVTVGRAYGRFLGVITVFGILTVGRPRRTMGRCLRNLRAFLRTMRLVLAFRPRLR